MTKPRALPAHQLWHSTSFPHHGKCEYRPVIPIKNIDIARDTTTMADEYSTRDASWNQDHINPDSYRSRQGKWHTARASLLSRDTLT